VIGERVPRGGRPGPGCEKKEEAQEISMDRPSLGPLAASRVADLVAQIERVILGKPEPVRLLVTGLLAAGHVLIEDVPGVGKSTLARALARSVSATFRRIQFTPDLLPSDITGISIFDRKIGDFVFKPGPVFGNIVLADEINRTTPRSQSAMLEAMNVGQVTVDGITHDLPRPFLVVATQNSLEYLGTYPLPEAQLDRFLLRVTLDYPDREHERQILRSRQISDPLQDIVPVLTGEDVVRLQQEVRNVTLSDPVLDYIQDIIGRTRDHRSLTSGASPRAGLGLFRSAQARALVSGRDHVLPDDVKALAVPVLAHRVMTRGEVRAAGGRDVASDVVREIVDTTPVPL